MNSSELTDSLQIRLLGLSLSDDYLRTLTLNRSQNLLQ